MAMIILQDVPEKMEKMIVCDFHGKSAYDKILKKYQPDGLIDHAEQGTQGS